MRDWNKGQQSHLELRLSCHKSLFLPLQLSKPAFPHTLAHNPLTPRIFSEYLFYARNCLVLGIQWLAKHISALMKFSVQLLYFSPPRISSWFLFVVSVFIAIFILFRHPLHDYCLVDYVCFLLALWVSLCQSVKILSLTACRSEFH